MKRRGLGGYVGVGGHDGSHVSLRLHGTGDSGVAGRQQADEQGRHDEGEERQPLYWRGSRFYDFVKPPLEAGWI